MSTIRPLATIAVLAALGVFLAYKINEGPPVAINGEWGAPGDAASGEAAAWTDGGGAGVEEPTIEMAPAAPSIPPVAAAGRTSPPVNPTAVAAPTLPDLPAFPAAPSPSLPATEPIEPPPVEGAPPGTTLATPAPAPAGAPSLPPPFAATPTRDESGATTVATPTITGRVPPLGSSVAAPRPVESPEATAFRVAWRAIETALERDELTRAHRMLSQWRTEPNLSPEQRGQVESLLSQLAGTVVYSTEHRLEPPRVVAAGETLQTIATEYNVPWQLLAKINGVPSPEAVQPGQTLKVVRGPFTAEVDLAAGNLVLLLDDRYAGRFPVRVEGQSPSGGEWRVAQKSMEPAGQPLVAPGPKVVLEGPAGEKLELGDAAAPATGIGGRLTVASNDLADLYDILSVGSAVTVRR